MRFQKFVLLDTFRSGALVALLAVPVAAVAQQSSLVHLKGGAAKISGVVKGKSYIDYRVKLGAGQTISVSLVSHSTSVYFNFNPPKSNASMHIGSFGSNRMSGRIVPIEGEHIIRVYQMGAAASERKSNSYAVTVRVSGAALKPLSGSVDAKLKGTPYHARAPITCKIALDRNRKTCEGYVIRRLGGSATVEFRVGSMIRRVLFVGGKPVAHDSPWAFTYETKGDQTILRFGDQPDEEYTVFEALMYGG